MAAKHNKTVTRRYVILLWFSWMLSDDTLYISKPSQESAGKVKQPHTVPDLEKKNESNTSKQKTIKLSSLRVMLIVNG
jgi:hypothetical protein